MRFGVLGPLRVWTDEGASVRVPELKVRALLANLLMHEGHLVPADRLIEDLWGRRLPANPTNAVQARISQLRRVLEDAEPGARELVVSRAPGYLLEVGADALDVGRFQHLAARARASTDPRVRAAALRDALALWRGPAFADVTDEPFARPTIARLEQERLSALEDLAEARLELGEHRVLSGELDELVAHHPLRERLRAAHLRALYRAGRPNDALDSYHDLRTRLRDELGTDPGPELVGLYHAILDHDPALQPKPGIVTGPPTNLPAAITELVGREDAVDRVCGLVGMHRLVTLVGPGGIGKTRLAVETANRLVAAFADGALLVELAGLDRIRDRNGAPAAAVAQLAELVGAACGLRDDPVTRPHPAAGAGGDPVARLVEAVRPRQVLLVLDNCEHVAAPVAELTSRLLAAAPDLRILATSREPLDIPGETLWTVPPLPLPDPSDTAPSSLLRSPAVALFAARAAAADPTFTVNATNSADVTTICRRLDGIPLALELAAARVRALGTRELAARLDDRFGVLTTVRRGVPARQQTLRATIDWSWELLDRTERAVLRRLSVHTDGATLAAAEDVCAGDGVDRTEVLDAVAGLVDRSLVTVSAGADGPRYRMFESIATYAGERLREAGELEQTQGRHSAHYLALAEHAAGHLRGREQRRWLDRLDAESPNLRTVLDRAVDAQDAETALRLVDALSWYWFLRGRLGEGRRSIGAALAVRSRAPAAVHASAATWLAALAMWARDESEPTDYGAAALAAHERVGDPVARARAQWLLGFAQWGFGDQSVALARVEQALVTFRTVDDQWGIAAALATRANYALTQDRLGAARRDAERSAELFDELGDRWGRLQAMQTLGTLAEITGDYPRAARLHRTGLRIAEDLALWTEVSGQLSYLGRIALLTGDLAGADDYHERARQHALAQSNQGLEQFAELGLALTARRRGDLERAETILHKWRRWNRERGEDYDALTPTAERGFIAELRGDAEAALALHRQGYRAACATGAPRAIALALEGLAGARALTGHHDNAAELLGTAAATRETVGAPLPPAERHDVDRITAVTRDHLGDHLFDAAFRRGTTRPADAYLDDSAAW